jgi:hypothetical protein
MPEAQVLQQNTGSNPSQPGVTTAYSKLAAVFLSEIIRSRRTSLSRAAEISEAVNGAIQNMKSEEEVLAYLTNIEKDFEEVRGLKEVLHFGLNQPDTKVYEQEIKDYAAELFKRDMVASSVFLQDAAKPGMTMQELCLRYPELAKRVSDKIPLMAQPALSPA